MFEEEILPRLVKIVIAAILIFTIVAAGGFLAGSFLFPHCLTATSGILSGGPIPPAPLPPGQPPLPVVSAPDAVLSYALGDLWAYTSAREQAALREMLQPLQDWARSRWPPFPDASPCP